MDKKMNVSSRDALILKTIEPILKEIEDTKKRQTVLDFWMKDCKRYMEQYESLAQDVKNEKTSLKEGCEVVKTITNYVLKKADDIDLLLDDRKIIKKIKHAFRELCGTWPYKSKVATRGLEKPRGLFSLT